jgi:hypothetical protein
VRTQPVASTEKNAAAVMGDGKRMWVEKDQPRSLPDSPPPLASMVWRKRRTERMDLGFLKICNDLDEKGRSGLGVGYHVLLCVSLSWI